jgi:hypothetical protein
MTNFGRFQHERETRAVLDLNESKAFPDGTNYFSAAGYDPD